MIDCRFIFNKEYNLLPETFELKLFQTKSCSLAFVQLNSSYVKYVVYDTTI